MNKLIYTLLIGFLGTSFLVAQENTIQTWEKASAEERKAMIKKMTPEEKKKLFREYRENAVVEQLQIPEKDQKAFKEVYSNYQESQRRIKDDFNNDFDPDKLTEDEARRKLDESFKYGERMIQNRREYAEKMQRVVKPQQVLKMFQNETQMRDKMLNRRMEMRSDSSGNNQGLRNSNPAEFNRRDVAAPGLRQNIPSSRAETVRTGIRQGTR